MNFIQTFSPSPILLELGPLTIRWYGLFLALSFVVGYIVASKLWKRAGRDSKELDKLFFWLLIWGVVGARVLDVFLFEWNYFQNNLGDIFKIWEGGLSIHGGLIAGFIVLFFYAKKHQIKLLSLLDIFAPAVALGQAVGRWGNYFNQEIFGTPTNLPWGIHIEPLNRPAGYLQYELFHPVFLYESIGLLILFWLLIRWSRRKIFPGRVFVYYLLGAGVLRFALEFIRVDTQLLVFGFRSGMLIATVMIILGIIVIFNTKQSKGSLEQV